MGKMQFVEEKMGEPLERILRRLYLDEHASLASIAKSFGVSTPTIRWHMKKYGIPIRTPKEAGTLKTGDRNPMYYACRSQEHRKKLSEAQKRRFRDEAVQWNSGKNLSAEHRNAISSGLKRYYENHHGPNLGRTGIRSTTFGRVPPVTASRVAEDAWLPIGLRKFRSFAEAVFAGVCAWNRVPWEYETKTFVLKGLDTTYTPDFYLPSLNILIEIKCWTSIPARSKLEAFLAQYRDETLVLLSHLDVYTLGVSYGGHRICGPGVVDLLPREFLEIQKPFDIATFNKWLKSRKVDSFTLDSAVTRINSDRAVYCRLQRQVRNEERSLEPSATA